MRVQGAKFNTPYVQIGVVTALDPLTVKLGDLEIGKDNLLIADYLLSNYGRKMTIPDVPATDITFTDGLIKDDVLALTPALELEGQKYIVLARLVSL